MLNVSIKQIKLKLLEDRVLLNNVNFTIEKNQVFTIVGKNGSGKSTLLKAIPKLLDSRFYNINGNIYYKGKDILLTAGKELTEIRKNKIKYVLQDAFNSFDHLKKFSYYFDRLTDAGSDRIAETDDLLKYFLLPGRGKLYNLYPYEVSGGMAQRISFVLALLAHPEIILLDEPTSGIDSAISNLFLLKLKEYSSAGNNCVLLVTHDLMFAEKAGNKIAFMAGGLLSEFTSPAEFFNQNKPGEAKDFIESYLRMST